jgi:hypothetical protein
MSAHCRGQGMALGWACRMAACHTNERLVAAGGLGGSSSSAEASAAQQVYRSALSRFLQLHFAGFSHVQPQLGCPRAKRKSARPAGILLATQQQQQLQEQQQRQQGVEVGQPQAHVEEKQQQEQNPGRPARREPHGHCCGLAAALNLVEGVVACGSGVAASSGSVHCMLLPLFDPVVSPRNTALVAVKGRSRCRARIVRN